jgi:hypothetical protein
MWVIYRKSDKRVVGASADMAIEIEKEQALQEVVGGLEGTPGLSEFDAVLVADRSKALEVLQALASGQAVIEEDRGGELSIVQDAPSVAHLVASIEAEALHPVDGVPLIPGDGSSFAVVTVKKLNDRGEALTRKKDNDVVWLRTDQGSLREDQDKDPQEIRSVKLASGTASFRLYSAAAKRLATVQLLSASPNLRGISVQVEFT